VKGLKPSPARLRQGIESRAVSRVCIVLQEHYTQAVVNHHFDVYSHCGDFCKRKSESEEERASTNKFYRNADQDKELLYVALKEIMGDNITTPNVLRKLLMAMIPIATSQ
jgi:hypothetical protein